MTSRAKYAKALSAQGLSAIVVALALFGCDNSALQQMAQGPSTTAPSVDANLSTPTVIPEVPFDVVIDVRYPDSMTGEVPNFAAMMTDLIPRDVRTEDMSKPGFKHTRVSLELMAPMEGAYTIPRFPVRFVTPTGDDEFAASTAIYFRVAFDPAKDVEDIRDIRPLRRKPPRYVLWGSLALAAIVLLLLLWKRKAIMQWWADRRKPPTPYELALRALDGLRDRDTGSNAAEQAFYYELSEVLRAYLSGTTGIHAQEMTTRELAHALLQAQVQDSTQLIDFFQRAEYPKYAASGTAVDPKRDFVQVNRWIQAHHSSKQGQSDAV